MVRSIWKGALVVTLAWVGLSWSQQPPGSTAAPATLTVQENGKQLPCRVILSWRTAAGAQAYQLQVLATGEMLTLVEEGPASSFNSRSGKMRSLPMKIYHWGRYQTSPPDAPVPPTMTVHEVETRKPIIISESKPILVNVGIEPIITPPEKTGPAASQSVPSGNGQPCLDSASGRPAESCRTCSPSVVARKPGCQCTATGKQAFTQSNPKVGINPIPGLGDQGKSNSAAPAPKASPYSPNLGPGISIMGVGTDASKSAKQLADPAQMESAYATLPGKNTNPTVPPVLPAPVPSPYAPLTGKESVGNPPALPNSPVSPYAPSPPDMAPAMTTIPQSGPTQPVPTQVAPGQPALTQMPNQPGSNPGLPNQTAPTQIVPSQPVVTQIPNQARPTQTVPSQPVVTQIPNQSVPTQIVPSQPVVTQIPNQSVPTQIVPSQPVVTQLPNQSVVNLAPSRVVPVQPSQPAGIYPNPNQGIAGAGTSGPTLDSKAAQAQSDASKKRNWRNLWGKAPFPRANPSKGALTQPGVGAIPGQQVSGQPVPNQIVPNQSIVANMPSKLVPTQPGLPSNVYPNPNIANAPGSGTTAATPVGKEAQAKSDSAKKRDWRNMWGKSLFSRTKQPGQTLVDPAPLGKGPALPGKEVVAGRNDTAFPPPPGQGPALTNKGPGAKLAQSPTPALPKSIMEGSKQPDPLENPERYQPAAVAKKVGPRSVYVPRPGAQPTVPPGNPTLPLGSVSVIAAQNGLKGPVQYVPVPVPTIPQPWRPPVPPAPEMPQAPQANAYVNAFTSPMPPPQNTGPQMPAGAFTAPPGNGPGIPPVTYGPMPYGPMPYGPGADPRMMAAYPNMPPQNMYGPGLNQGFMPPTLTNPLPAYAYQQMAMGMVPQRPSAQVNYPVTYQGPTPPNPFSAPANRPYMPVYPANPAMDRPGMALPAPAAPLVQASFQLPHLVANLRDSIYPAQREWAAINLAGPDMRTQPEAVQVLLTAARQDPAGSVRAACVRSLAQFGPNHPQVLGTLNDLKNDHDPRVRQEVEKALGQVRR